MSLMNCTNNTITSSPIFDPSSFEMWDPFKACPFLTDLTRPFVTLRGADRISQSFVTPRLDWKETEDEYVLKLDIPGLRKQEVKVEVEEGNVLSIRGERSVEEKKEKGVQWHRVERSGGKFLRRLRLPENAKIDEVKAEMENGVLTVIVSKVEVKKPEVKNIEIEG